MRHGESTWNAAGRWQGTEDPPLTEVGEQQAASVAAALGSFDAVYASSLRRALLTAEIIAESIGVGPVIVDARLAERYAGAWQGLTRAEIDEDWPGYLADGRRPDDFEPDAELSDRGAAALDDIASAIGDGEALAVSHSGMLYSLEKRWHHWRGRIPNLGGIWFERDQNGRWSVGDRVDIIAATTGAGIIE